MFQMIMKKHFYSNIKKQKIILCKWIVDIVTFCSFLYIYSVSHACSDLCNRPLQFSSVQFSHSVMSGSLRPHGLQQAFSTIVSKVTMKLWKASLSNRKRRYSLYPCEDFSHIKCIQNVSHKLAIVPWLSSVWLCDPWNCSMPSVPCPSPSPRVCLDSCPLSGWRYPTISCSAAPFSSCLQSFPSSGSFLKHQLFPSGGQSTGVSASASVLSMNIQLWFLLGLIGLISLLSKGLSRVFSSTTIQKHQCGGNFRHSVLSVKGSYSHWVKHAVNCVTDL